MYTIRLIYKIFDRSDHPARAMPTKQNFFLSAKIVTSHQDKIAFQKLG